MRFIDRVEENWVEKSISKERQWVRKFLVHDKTVIWVIFLTKSFQCLGMQSKWECEEWVPSVLIGDDITFDSGSEGKFYLEKVVCCIDISD